MDFLENENVKLKQIIRKNDDRIYYLEKKLENMAKYNQNVYCQSCSLLCDYDEEKCNCNMFCNKYLCRKCVNTNNTLYFCNFYKCKKWYCNIDYSHNYCLVCTECNKTYCEDHIYINVSNVCNDCYVKTEYDYCEK
jgi:hypothetical protein